MGKHSLLICLLISLSPILLCSPSRANSTYLDHFCRNESTYNTSSPFYDNLNRLLYQRLYNEGSISWFFNTSVGTPPDEAYGLFLCRGDVDPGDCQSCIDEATSKIMNSCPGRKNVIVWFDECLVRYSDWNFFAVMEDSPALFLYNTANATYQEKLTQTVVKTFPELIEKVVSDPSKKMYGTANVSFSSLMTLYEQVQCFPGLSPTNCSTCLNAAISRLPTFSMGARTLLPSCNIRYEMYPFYGTPRGQEPLPPPNDNPSNNRTNTTNPRSPQANQDGDSDRSKSTKGRWITIVGSVGAACLVVSLASYFIISLRKRNLKKETSSQELQLLHRRRQVGSDGFPNYYSHEENPVDSHEFPLMQLEVIRAATNYFSNENKLGEGGFGPVYKGILGDGKEIAVKRLSGNSGQGLLELRTEVTLIARLQHRNLVRLLGCCLENDEKLLIYEYMPNKILDIYLFGSSAGVGLNWKRRLNIIDGIARGLLYLHEDSRLRIIHRDLKASNILLDDDMNPKISDFGMARIVGGNQTGDTTDRVVGTYGYMSPEYAMEGLFSVKSDVFSFGVLLLEILSGKRNNGFHLHQHGQSLLTYAWRLWGEGRGLELIDPLIGESVDMAQALKCIHIGLLCVQEEPANRPIMSYVVLILRGDTISLPQPTQPAFSVGRPSEELDEVRSNKADSSINGLTITNASPR